MPLRAGLAGLGALVLAMFFDVLFVPGPRVLGVENTDLGLHFLHWRRFGFDELAGGNLALWNPHIYAGVPFFGGMQSALLYPLNWLFLALPLPLAANLSIALNVWLLGAFMYLWALRRSLHPFAAFVAASLAMFCAPHFLRVYAGHVAGMASMAWTPLVFLAIDAWLESRRGAWLLVGMLAVAMQVFTGHPQTAYLTGLTAGLYGLLRMQVVGVAAIYAGGAALAAVQLLTGFQAAAETIRDRPMTIELASYFSFPTENFVTLVAPGFFGDFATHPYWGRWYLWEASAFIGVVGLALCIYGIARGTLAGKRALLATAGGAAVLALGDNTLLFPVLFDWLPWFNRFRGAGKFIYVTALILVLFAAAGMDRILRERGVPRRAVWAAGAGALVLGAAGMLIQTVDWGPVAASVALTGQTYLEPKRYLDAGFLSASRSFAALGMMVATLTLAAATGLLLWTRREPRAALVLGVLAVAEIFAYARLNRPTFDSRHIVIPELANFLARNPGDYRILSLVQPNSAISMKAFDAWGYDPGITRRYAEFINWSAGTDPEETVAHVNWHQFHPLLAIVRVKYIVTSDGREVTIHPGATPPLGRLELIGSHEVRAGRTAILQAMDAPGFDPRKRVILEREPAPAPVAGESPGRARILREGSDFMEIEAQLDRPSVLLVTDAWTPGWRAVPLEAGEGRRYELVPANYVLRAVALDRGTHKLRLEYAPPAFRIGMAISLAAWAAWLAAAAVAWHRRARRG